MKNNLKFPLIFLALFVGFQLVAVSSVQAQRRDHLNEMEVEIVRDVQAIDLRMEVYIRAIDRRFAVLNNDLSQTKQFEKDTEKWGAPPKGSRAELLRDIEKILDESISKVDDVASRDLKNKLFPVAVNILADGANRFIPELKTQLDKATDEIEKGAILNAVEFCNQIIEAAAKVPKLSPKERKKIQKENDKAQESN